MNAMKLADPVWMWLLPVVLVWGAAWGWALVRNYRRRLRRYSDRAPGGEAVPATAFRAKLAGHLLLLLALVCIVTAIARPQGKPRPAPGARVGVNLAILVDASVSMRSEDALPSRIQLARHTAESIAAEAPGSRISLFMFGGAPTLMIPGTFDTTSVILAARSISPDFVGKGGTAMVPALRRAATYLEKAGRQPKAIVVISDGEEGEGDPILMAAELNQHSGIPVHTITVGTPEGGTIPIYARNLRGELERAGDRLTQAKQPIITRANPDLLARVAQAGGGLNFHVRAETLQPDVAALVRDGVMRAAVPIDNATTEQPVEYAWLLVVLAIAALTAEQWLRHEVSRRFALQPLPLRRDAVWRDAALQSSVEAGS